MALKHLRTLTHQPGQILCILLSWVQAYHGTSAFVWAKPSAVMPGFPAPWVDGVRQALRSINGTITIPFDDSILLKRLRENDEFLMDAAMNGLNESMLVGGTYRWLLLQISPIPRDDKSYPRQRLATKPILSRLCAEKVSINNGLPRLHGRLGGNFFQPSKHHAVSC